MSKNRKKLVPVTNLSDPKWEMQRYESPKLYSYFVLYRDIGTSRTFAQVAAEVGIRAEHVSDYAKRWRWNERVAAWEKHLQEVKDQEIIDAAKTMARRQARLGMILQDKAEVALAVVDLSEPTVKDVVMLAEAGVKIERQARGEKVEDDRQVVINLPIVPDWAKSSQFITAKKDESTQGTQGS